MKHSEYLESREHSLSSSALQHLGDYTLRIDEEFKVISNWTDIASKARPQRNALNPDSWIGILKK